MNVKYLSLFCLLLPFMVMTGCKDLLDVTEDFSFEHEFLVEGSSLSFSRSEVIDLMEKSDVLEEYGDKLKQIDIKKVEYWLKTHPGGGNQKLVSGSLKVGDAAGAGLTTVASIQDQFLSMLFDNPHVLALNNDGVVKMNFLIKEAPHQLTLALDGTLNEGPLGFIIVFKFSGTLTANPLK